MNARLTKTERRFIKDLYLDVENGYYPQRSIGGLDINIERVTQALERADIALIKTADQVVQPAKVIGYTQGAEGPEPILYQSRGYEVSRKMYNRIPEALRAMGIQLESE